MLRFHRLRPGLGGGDESLRPLGQIAAEKLHADGRAGRKNKKGFYTYVDKQKQVDDTVDAALGIKPPRSTAGSLPAPLLVEMAAQGERFYRS